MLPTVSINLCCYNSEKYLSDTLESVVKQTSRDWELVIINDGSTDSTEAIIKGYIDLGLPIIYHYQQNRGLGYSRNEAFKRSSGKYIAFIDHDDIWMPEKLEKQLAVFEKDAEVDFVYANYYVVRDKRRVIKFRSEQPSGYVFEKFLFNYPVHISTAIIRRKAFDKLNDLFNPNLHLTEEYDLFMRILYTAKAGYISRPLATYRYHPDMASATKEVRLIKETISVIETFKLLDPDFSKKHAHILDKVTCRNNFALSFKLAKNELSNGNSYAARDIIRPYRFLNAKSLLFYILTLFPGLYASSIWSSFLKIKKALDI